MDTEEYNDYDNTEEYDDYDYCYECSGYGDDYYYDEELGKLVCACDTCPFNSSYDDD